MVKQSRQNYQTVIDHYFRNDLMDIVRLLNTSKCFDLDTYYTTMWLDIWAEGRKCLRFVILSNTERLNIQLVFVLFVCTELHP